MKRAMLLALLAGLFAVPIGAQGQNPPAPRDPVPQRQEIPAPPAPVDQFMPMSKAPKQPEIAAAPLLYVAYAFVWAALLIYVFMLWRRIGRVERELADVHRRMKS